MSKSIMQSRKVCFLCGAKHGEFHEHHIFGGNPNRKLSEKYGLKVWLCSDFTPNKCHKQVHEGAGTKELQAYLHREGQKAFEEVHGTREDFMREFGRNYLYDRTKTETD